MIKKNHFYPAPSFITGFIVFSIVLIAFIAYKDILGFFFSSDEILMLVDKSRINSFSDFVKIIIEPQLSDIEAYTDYARFYRPITTISYSIDYAIWGLNPFGYQLTNLILHVLMSVLVYYFTRLLLKGRQATAWLSAVVFATHPILVNDVPLPVSRYDMIVAIFLVLSLWTFLKYHSDAPSKKYFLFLSMLFCAFAFGTKEVGIVVTPIIFGYLLVFSEERSLKMRLISAVKGSLPFIMTIVGSMLWRIYVLGTVGGYAQKMKKPLNIISSYFVDLLYPVDFLKLFSVVPETFLFTMSSFAVCLIAIFNYNGLKSFFTYSVDGKVIAFLLIWILQPLIIYLYAFTFRHSYLYIPAVPFSIILSIIFIESLRYVKTMLSGGSSLMVSVKHKAFSIIISVFILSSLFSYSPLIRTYSVWENSAKIFSMFLNKLSKIAPDLPNNATIVIHNLAREVSSSGAMAPRMNVYTSISSIKSWLNLDFPNNNMKILSARIPLREMYLKSLPSDIDLKINMEGKDTVEIIIQYRYGDNGTDGGKI